MIVITQNSSANSLLVNPKAAALARRIQTGAS
jgi:hypothetical protein